MKVALSTTKIKNFRISCFKWGEGMERREFGLNGGGKLTLREEGGVVQLQVQRPDDRRGLYKVWICGTVGRLLLGTLVPEGGELRLHRRLSRGQLEREGCWPVAGGEVVLAFPFGQEGWQREEHPERLVKDAVLRQALRGQTMLLCRGKTGFLLSAPFDTGRPFPLTPLFCLARVERGRAIFSFDGEGKPLVPNKRGKNGETNGTP